MLITNNFRYASGLLARNVQIAVTPQDSTTVITNLVTDQQGFVSVDLPPGQYDWWYQAGDYRVPFEVASTPTTVAEDLDDHIVSLTPHPAYDDIPSLVLQFENGLV
jgi:hypothetical protein